MNQYLINLLYFRSDAIPQSTDTISRTIGMIVGLGTVSSLMFGFFSKAIFGFYFSTGGKISSCII